MRTTGDTQPARSLLEQNDRWYQSAGGGDGALLTKCLLAAVNARTISGGNADELHDILDQGLRAGDPEVQVYATDALARLAHDRGTRQAHELLQVADDIAAAAAHVVDSSDRVDGDHVRAHLAGAAQPTRARPSDG